MGLNPLKVPKWNCTPSRPIPLTRWSIAEPSTAPPPTTERRKYLTREEELAEAAAAADRTITIEIRSVQGHPGGKYCLAYEGGSLGSYLTKLEAKQLAINNAVYDLSNPEKGRLRLIYQPGPGAHILIGSAASGPNSHLQRSNGDPRPRSNSPILQDISMRYGPALSIEKPGTDDLDIAQL